MIACESADVRLRVMRVFASCAALMAVMVAGAPRAAAQTRAEPLSFCSPAHLFSCRPVSRDALNASAGQAQEPQAKPQKKKPEWRVRFIWKDTPPSLRIRGWARVDFRVKLQADWVKFSPEIETLEGLFDWHRIRYGLEGDLFDENVEYQIEYETTDRVNPWRDVFANVRYFRDAQIQFGKFKIPFSQEQTTSAYNQDFIYRSLAAQELAPGRDIGVMVHGRILQRAFNYEAGVFRQDGEINRSRFRSEPLARPHKEEATVAGRVTVLPFQLTGATSAAKDIELGGAFTWSKIPEGLNGLQGEMTFGHDFFERLYVKGRRLRMGAEASWMPGPFRVRAELIQVRESRDEQGLRGDDLPDGIATGWYVSGSWTITGEPKAGGIVPRRPFPLSGVGAIELAARLEQLRFSSADLSDEPLRNPRAFTVYPNRNRVWTFGVSWYPQKLFKVQINGIREELEDIERRPFRIENVYWSGVARIQFVL